MSACIATRALAPAWRLRLSGAHLAGLLAGLCAATIWGGALAMTRHGVAAGSGTLAPDDIVLLRFLAPAALLLPIALRRLARLRRDEWRQLAVLFAGGGAPFVLLAGAGLRQAEAADAGALLPGTMPLWVAVTALLSGRAQQGFAAQQRVGLALMALAVALVAGPPLMSAEGPEGPLMLLGASWLSAAYTLALKRSPFKAIEATALVSLGSVATILPIWLLTADPALASAGWKEIATQAAWQGGMSGLIAPVAFAYAVSRLGAARAASLGALSPASAALFGLLLLGESPDPHVALGLVAAALGVGLAALRRPG
ncbi:EamA family transporter [Roseomonas sp. AR75]|uniref:EamA family transporter n=1 Tax=Roseomonas sp. AR75 TaxID=2562311 RepID=UPI00148586A2|nr:EamA family transporter [Roseomonas sp. AR75]